MPIYEYQCQDCGNEFTTLRPMRESHAMSDCPHCGEPSPRVLITAPALSTLPAATRRAHEVNERSAHAPRSSRSGAEGRSHPAGCGCCTGSVGRTKTVTSADGKKAFPSKRPWMISH